MYIRRKVFSIVKAENGEEKLFSVNSKLERVKLFSKKEEEADSKKKMKLGDKIDLFKYKHLMSKRGRAIERDRIDDVIDKEATKRDRKRAAIKAAAELGLGTAAGAGVGKLIGGSAKDGAKLGAVIGGAAGVGTLVGSEEGRALKKLGLKHSEKYRKTWDKQRDLLDVAEGKKSEEEYIKKHGK